MGRSIALAAFIGLVLSASSAAATSTDAPRPHRHRHFQREIGNAPRAESRVPGEEARPRRVVEPSTRDNPGDQGSEDGLSTNPDNCNTGCVGGNPD